MTAGARSRASPRLVRAARLAAGAAGAGLVLAGLLASTSRVTLVVAGGATLAAAFAGPRLGRAYRPAAVVLLSALLLLAALEVAATAVVALAHTPAIQARLARLIGPAHDLVDHYLSLPYHGSLPWSGAYWEEHERAVRQRYEPYAVWANPPFRGQHINVGEDGSRAVPGARCGEGAYRVHVYGGSAMWGWGAPDAVTIPAFLQAELQRARGGPVCVVNRAENAYVAAQELLRLHADLVAGRVPDLALFYDGVNEVLAGVQNGRPWTHQNLAAIAFRFEDRRSPLLVWLDGRSLPYLVRTLAAWAAPAGEPPARPDAEELGGRVVESYLHVAGAAADLGRRYGFETRFVWQPHILAGGKPLVPEERRMVEELGWLLDLDEWTVRVFRAAYARAEREAAARPDLHYAAGALDGVGEGVWLDTWGHLTPAGNEVVSQWIVGELGRAPSPAAQPAAPDSRAP